MSATLHGERTWSMERNEDGQRTYKLTSLIVTDSTNDGPGTVMACPGLPVVGVGWDYGNDDDPYAICSPQLSVRMHGQRDGDPDFWWSVENTFTTIPNRRCQDTTIEDPLAEPDRVGGTYTKKVREATRDRFGNPILNSSWELMKGPIVEFDSSDPGVWVEQNVSNLQLNVFSEMIDHVNGHPLWGLPPRCVKLGSIVWERLYFGSCSIYYKRTFEFDISFSTFDRLAADEGTRVLRGDWHRTTTFVSGQVGSTVSITQPPRWVAGENADPNDPLDFINYKDTRGEPGTVVLNGFGCPWSPKYYCNGDIQDDYYNDPILPGSRLIEYYPEANFLILGIPLVL